MSGSFGKGLFDGSIYLYECQKFKFCHNGFEGALTLSFILKRLTSFTSYNEKFLRTSITSLVLETLDLIPSFWMENKP